MSESEAWEAFFSLCRKQATCGLWLPGYPFDNRDCKSVQAELLIPLLLTSFFAATMTSTPHRIRVRQHPGSSQEDVEREPDWETGHQNRIGYRNRQDRIPGLTHQGDEKERDGDFERRALKEIDQLHNRVKKGDLINFRDAITQQKASTTKAVWRASCNAQGTDHLFPSIANRKPLIGLPPSPTRRPFSGMALCA